MELRRRLSTSLGTLWPWTVEARYFLSAWLRRIAKSPVEQDFRILKKLKVESGYVFCDVGCNRGQSIDSFLMFNRCPVVAFEPNPITFAKTKDRFRDQADILIHNIGLSDEHASRTLYIPKYRQTYFDELASFDSTSPLSWLSEAHLVGVDPTKIELEKFLCEVHTLDEYKLPVAMIKIDVQGLEERVVRGGWSTIEQHRPVLLIENDNKSSAEGVFQLLQKLEYVPYRFDGELLRPNEFGSPNTFYIVPRQGHGLESVFYQS